MSRKERTMVHPTTASGRMHPAMTIWKRKEFCCFVVSAGGRFRIERDGGSIRETI